MKTETIVQQLKEMGCKLTPQRRMLVDVLVGAANSALTVEEIYQQIKTIYPDVGLDTVYRNLRLLVKLNVVIEVKRSGKLAQYSLNRSVHHHGLVCLDCGVEIALRHCPIKELELVAKEEHGFMIASHRIELFGYCPACYEARQSS